MLPFPPRALAPDYLSENPLGTVPLLVDGTVRMTESAAICQFLADRHGPTPLGLRTDEPDYGAYLNWLSFGEATLTFPQAVALRYGRFEKDRGLLAVADDYGRWFMSRLRAVDAAVTGRETLCGDRFSMADISVGYALLLAEIGGYHPRFSPALSAYWRRLSTRDGFQRAKAAQAREAAAAGVPLSW